MFERAVLFLFHFISQSLIHTQFMPSSHAAVCICILAFVRTVKYVLPQYWCKLVNGRAYFKALKPRLHFELKLPKANFATRCWFFFASKFYNKQTLSWGFSSLCKNWGQNSHTMKGRGGTHGPAVIGHFQLKSGISLTVNLNTGPLCLSATKTGKHNIINIIQNICFNIFCSDVGCNCTAPDSFNY